MKIDKTLLTVSLASVAPLAAYAATILAEKKVKKSADDKVSLKDIDWMLDCMDDMIADMREMKQKQNEQTERMAKIEGALALLNNLNTNEGSANEHAVG